MNDDRRTVVVADANVLINLIHVNRLDLCARLEQLQFVVPDHVRAELTDPAQRETLDRAVSVGVLELVSITSPEDIMLLADLTGRLGRGEAACLVLAQRNGWSIASDERGRFRREATARIGEARLLGTVQLYLHAIRTGVLTVDQADADKATLETHRFRMRFRSFRDLDPDNPEVEPEN